MRFAVAVTLAEAAVPVGLPAAAPTGEADVSVVAAAGSVGGAGDVAATGRGVSRISAPSHTGLAVSS